MLRRRFLFNLALVLTLGPLPANASQIQVLTDQNYESSILTPKPAAIIVIDSSEMNNDSLFRSNSDELAYNYRQIVQAYKHAGIFFGEYDLATETEIKERLGIKDIGVLFYKSEIITSLGDKELARVMGFNPIGRGPRNNLEQLHHYSNLLL